MRPRHSAAVGEDHQPACCAPQMEPPNMMDPAPALDEAISDPGHHDLWGHTLGKKQPNNIQIVFQNVGGLILSTNSNLKLTVLKQFICQHNIDIFNVAKHNKCGDVVPKNLQFHEQTKGWWENTQWSIGYNKRKIKPSKHEPGGTGILVVNEFSHHAC